MPKSKDALKILDALTGNDEELRAMIEAESLNARVAQLIYDARTEANLTQAALARLVGTSQPVIARLEDCDYQGHSLRLLQRIAAALNKRIDIQFRARRPRRSPGATPASCGSRQPVSSTSRQRRQARSRA